MVNELSLARPFPPLMWFEREFKVSHMIIKIVYYWKCWRKNLGMQIYDHITFLHELLWIWVYCSFLNLLELMSVSSELWKLRSPIYNIQNNEKMTAPLLFLNLNYLFNFIKRILTSSYRVCPLLYWCLSLHDFFPFGSLNCSLQLVIGLLCFPCFLLEMSTSSFGG